MDDIRPSLNFAHLNNTNNNNCISQSETFPHCAFVSNNDVNIDHATRMCVMHDNSSLHSAAVPVSMGAKQAGKRGDKSGQIGVFRDQFAPGVVQYVPTTCLSNNPVVQYIGTVQHLEHVAQPQPPLQPLPAHTQKSNEQLNSPTEFCHQPYFTNEVMESNNRRTVNSTVRKRRSHRNTLSPRLRLKHSGNFSRHKFRYSSRYYDTEVINDAENHMMFLDSLDPVHESGRDHSAKYDMVSRFLNKQKSTSPGLQRYDTYYPTTLNNNSDNINDNDNNYDTDEEEGYYGVYFYYPDSEDDLDCSGLYDVTECSDYPQSNECESRMATVSDDVKNGRDHGGQLEENDACVFQRNRIDKILSRYSLIDDYMYGGNDLMYEEIILMDKAKNGDELVWKV